MQGIMGHQTSPIGAMVTEFGGQKGIDFGFDTGAVTPPGEVQLLTDLADNRPPVMQEIVVEREAAGQTAGGLLGRQHMLQPERQGMRPGERIPML